MFGTFFKNLSNSKSLNRTQNFLKKTIIQKSCFSDIFCISRGEGLYIANSLNVGAVIVILIMVIKIVIIQNFCFYLHVNNSDRVFRTHIDKSSFLSPVTGAQSIWNYTCWSRRTLTSETRLGPVFIGQHTRVNVYSYCAFFCTPYNFEKVTN